MPKQKGYWMFTKPGERWGKLPIPATSRNVAENYRKKLKIPKSRFKVEHKEMTIAKKYKGWRMGAKEYLYPKKEKRTRKPPARKSKPRQKRKSLWAAIKF